MSQSNVSEGFTNRHIRNDNHHRRPLHNGRRIPCELVFDSHHETVARDVGRARRRRPSARHTRIIRHLLRILGGKQQRCIGVNRSCTHRLRTGDTPIRDIRRHSLVAVGTCKHAYTLLMCASHTEGTLPPVC
jgi:hypothetical protein